MAKRILMVALVAPMLALAHPAPAAAHVGFLVSIGLPFFGAVIGVPPPYPYYTPPVYAPYAYAPYGYGPAPAYVPAPVYGPRYFYGSGRVFVPAYGRYGYRGRYVGHHYHRW